jgi:hypothetical protein
LIGESQLGSGSLQSPCAPKMARAQTSEKWYFAIGEEAVAPTGFGVPGGSRENAEWRAVESR